jgi:hypothetical protein
VLGSLGLTSPEDITFYREAHISQAHFSHPHHLRTPDQTSAYREPITKLGGDTCGISLLYISNILETVWEVMLRGQEGRKNIISISLKVLKSRQKQTDINVPHRVGRTICDDNWLKISIKSPLNSLGWPLQKTHQSVAMTMSIVI